jgi:hypothetical protein
VFLGRYSAEGSGGAERRSYRSRAVQEPDQTRFLPDCPAVYLPRDPARGRRGLSLAAHRKWLPAAAVVDLDAAVAVR